MYGTLLLILIVSAALGTALADHRVITLAVVYCHNILCRPLGWILDTLLRLITSCVLAFRLTLKQIDWQPLKTMICPYKIFSIIVDNIRKYHKISKIIIKISKNKNRTNNS